MEHLWNLFHYIIINKIWGGKKIIKKLSFVPNTINYCISNGIIITSIDGNIIIINELNGNIIQFIDNKNKMNRQIHQMLQCVLI